MTTKTHRQPYQALRIQSFVEDDEERTKRQRAEEAVAADDRLEYCDHCHTVRSEADYEWLRLVGGGADTECFCDWRCLGLYAIAVAGNAAWEEDSEDEELTILGAMTEDGWMSPEP